MARPQLGVDWFARGEPEPPMVVTSSVLDVSLYELLKAYAGQKQRAQTDDTLHIRATELYSMDLALKRLTEMLGRLPGWSTLSSFLPSGIGDPLVARSALAATFAASLELAKTGHVQLRQDSAFDDIYIRGAEPQEQRLMTDNVVSLAGESIDPEHAQHVRLVEALLFAAAEAVGRRGAAVAFARGCGSGGHPGRS